MHSKTHRDRNHSFLLCHPSLVLFVILLHSCLLDTALYCVNGASGFAVCVLHPVNWCDHLKGIWIGQVVLTVQAF